MIVIREVITAGLLLGGVASAALAVLGTVLRRGAYDRLHYAGAASSVAAILIGAALLVDGTEASAAGELVLVLLTVAVGGPLASHALARSFLVRERGDWRIDAETPDHLDAGP